VTTKFTRRRAVSAISIRPALAKDAPVLAAIYSHYVEQTAISFEETAPCADEFAARIERCRSRWQWLVAEIDGTTVGYAYGSEHRQRPAYRWSVEVSAYVASSYQRRGIGRALYDVLLADLAERGFCNAFAGITLPNEASVGLHTRMGFAPIGIFRSVGWKFGRWRDVAWFQRKLSDYPPLDGTDVQ
jgi:L-amino acid N-acyltransferase YncA